MRATFDVVPFGKTGGWGIDESGQPRLWWQARLNHYSSITMSDGTDAREHEASISIYVGKETPLGQTLYTGDDPPSPKFGFVATSKELGIRVQLWLSAENVDRLMQSIQFAPPPKITVGFGPAGFGKLTGSIVRANYGDGYRWNDADDKGYITVESVEISQSFASPEEPPETPDETPKPLRYLGIAWSTAVTLVSVLIALTAMNAAKSRFETVIVGVLLLIYILLTASNKALFQMLGQLDYFSLKRFLDLRGALGVPTTPAEEKYMTHIRKKITRATPQAWIDAAGASVVGLIVFYRLGSLLL